MKTKKKKKQNHKFLCLGTAESGKSTYFGWISNKSEVYDFLYLSVGWLQDVMIELLKTNYNFYETIQQTQNDKFNLTPCIYNFNDPLSLQKLEKFLSYAETKVNHSF